MASYAVAANGNYPDNDGVALPLKSTAYIKDPSGASVAIEVNDGNDNWLPLTDSSGTAVAITGAAVYNIEVNRGSEAGSTTVTVRFAVTSYSSAFTIVAR